MTKLGLLSGFLAVAITVTVSACGDTSTGQPTSKPMSSDYFFEVVQTARGNTQAAGFETESLEATLPNVSYVTPAGDSFAASDALIAGRVMSVEKGAARRHVEGTGEGYEDVPFDDPSADERTVIVEVDVEQRSGAGAQDGPVAFRLGLLGSTKPERFIEALQALEDVVVLLAAVPDGPDKGILIPVMQGALIGEVDNASGSISFAGLGSAEREFVGDLSTIEALFAAANGPALTEQLK